MVTIELTAEEFGELIDAYEMYLEDMREFIKLEADEADIADYERGKQLMDKLLAAAHGGSDDVRGSEGDDATAR